MDTYNPMGIPQEELDRLEREEDEKEQYRDDGREDEEIPLRPEAPTWIDPHSLINNDYWDWYAREQVDILDDVFGSDWR